MRMNDVNELLKEIAEIIELLETEKLTAYSNKEKVALSAPKIKSAHEHLRSAFEFMAHDIYELLRKIYAENNRQVKEIDLDRLYFPIRKEPKDFKLAIQKDYRFIDEFCPNIFSLLESIQPYNKNDKWLLKLRVDTNNNKHNRFTEQERVETSHVIIGGETGGGIRLIPRGGIDAKVGSVNLQGKEMLTENLDFKNGKITNAKVLPKDSKVEEIVGFNFKGSISDVIHDLKYYHQKTSDFTDSFYKMLANY